MLCVCSDVQLSVRVGLSGSTSISNDGLLGNVWPPVMSRIVFILRLVRLLSAVSAGSSGQAFKILKVYEKIMGTLVTVWAIIE